MKRYVLPLVLKQSNQNESRLKPEADILFFTHPTGQNKKSDNI